MSIDDGIKLERVGLLLFYIVQLELQVRWDSLPCLLTVFSRLRTRFVLYQGLWIGLRSQPITYSILTPYLYRNSRLLRGLPVQRPWHLPSRLELGTVNDKLTAIERATYASLSSFRHLKHTEPCPYRLGRARTFRLSSAPSSRSFSRFGSISVTPMQSKSGVQPPH